MLDTSANSVKELRQRTRDRNAQVWSGMLAGTDLAQDELTLLTISLPEIEAPIAITDEDLAVKDFEMRRAHFVTMEHVRAQRQAIIDGFAFAQSKLADLTILWQIKDQEEAMRIKNVNDEISETLVLLTAEETSEDLRLTAEQNEQLVQNYDKNRNLAELQAEAALKAQVVAAKQALQNADANSKEAISNLRRQMKLMVNAARIALAAGRTRYTFRQTSTDLTDSTQITEVIVNED